MPLIHNRGGQNQERRRYYISQEDRTKTLMGTYLPWRQKHLIQIGVLLFIFILNWCSAQFASFICSGQLMSLHTVKLGVLDHVNELHVHLLISPTWDSIQPKSIHIWQQHCTGERSGTVHAAPVEKKPTCKCTAHYSTPCMWCSWTIE